MDWSKIKCTTCSHHKKCKKKSIRKSSIQCQITLGLKKEKDKVPSKEQLMAAFMWNQLKDVEREKVREI